MTDNQQADMCRLDTLAGLDILDTPREPAFDRLTRLCRSIFDVPMSTLTLIDNHRQWFKASEGIEDRQTARQPALCNLAIQETEPLVITDTFLDPRVSENVFVRNSPFVRFYAGAQIRISGVTIGSLCAIDTKPRRFDQRDIAILKDLAAVTEDELLLRNLSMQDNLTGALSRRALRAEGEQLTALANRHGHRLACAVLDVDHFKSINDRYGHATGDIVLAAVVETCRNSLRGSDVVGRLGGEEFGILLPHTNLAEALGALEKARAAVAGRRVETPCGPISVTCSFGGAALSAGQNFDDLLHCADMAMYGAKNAGRNQVVAWVDPAPSISPVKRRVLKAGQLTFNAGRSTFDCTVSALSQEAATLKVISSAGVPDRFKLIIPSDGLSRACSVLSKRDNQIEVVFA